MSENYKIGQVLYVVSEAKQQVIPVQVFEIHKRETIDGEEIVFMVQDPKETGPYNLDEIDGQVFIEHSEVSSFLKKQANTAIDEMVNFAVRIAKEKFQLSDSVFRTSKKRGRKPKEPSETQSKSQSQSRKEAEEEIEDEDGVIETQDAKGNVQKLRIGKIHYPDFKEPAQPKGN